MLAFFLSGLSMSPEGGKQMGKAAAELTIMGSRKPSKPTVDHLVAEEKAQKNQSKAASANEPRAGSFEKLTAIFGGRGQMISFPKPPQE